MKIIWKTEIIFGKSTKFGKIISTFRKRKLSFKRFKFTFRKSKYHLGR
jgi:hypothetical protein